MRKIRQLHLWIGLLTSFLILIEAITGLLMLEPHLMGIDKPAPEQRVMREEPVIGQDLVVEDIEREVMLPPARHFKPSGQGSSIMRFVRNLHAGRIGNADVSLLLSIVAVGLIIITVTGMVLSVRALKVQWNK
ncbi:hypothetical protein SPSYN_01131 [Sporotomaculum syntrophicum]|uniref:PepSY-associated TM helix n=1 Tax=Sporotomaculum syntrophicum TaxID=182264 RepID=A0A9D2WPZ8_9FIRM|nr:PepSY-associated TM helix domain-containing protein [Sporotomaculum syntrophicum]KAF1084995.1 hypothetical protein SPSYN_01131 [Sporotomaculum syntrophicum]